MSTPFAQFQPVPMTHSRRMDYLRQHEKHAARLRTFASVGGKLSAEEGEWLAQYEKVAQEAFVYVQFECGILARNKSHSK